MDVFISYRREDTKDIAGRLADHLATVGEIDNVFIDVTSIHKGEVFEAKIDHELARSDACIILIGKQWLGPRKQHKPRIFDDGDFVRGEVSLALDCKVKAFPVLVNGARMPTTEELPDNLAGLNRINAAQLDHDSFDQDFDALVGALLGDPDYQLKRPFWRKLLRSLIKPLLGAAAGLIAFLLAALLHFAITGGKGMDDSVGGLAGVFAIGLVFVAVGAIVPMWRRRR